MKQILLIALLCVGITSSAQTTLTPNINGIRINRTTYPWNVTLLDIQADSVYVAIGNANLSPNDNKRWIVPAQVYSVYINGLTGQPFASVSKMDSFFAAYFLR